LRIGKGRWGEDVVRYGSDGVGDVGNGRGKVKRRWTCWGGVLVAPLDVGEEVLVEDVCGEEKDEESQGRGRQGCIEGWRGVGHLGGLMVDRSRMKGMKGIAEA
jgi:hypothetical protein